MLILLYVSCSQVVFGVRNDADCLFWFIPRRFYLTTGQRLYIYKMTVLSSCIPKVAFTTAPEYLALVVLLHTTILRATPTSLLQAMKSIA